MHTIQSLRNLLLNTFPRCYLFVLEWARLNNIAFALVPRGTTGVASIDARPTTLQVAADPSRSFDKDRLSEWAWGALEGSLLRQLHARILYCFWRGLALLTRHLVGVLADSGPDQALSDSAA